MAHLTRSDAEQTESPKPRRQGKLRGNLLRLLAGPAFALSSLLAACQPPSQPKSEVSRPSLPMPQGVSVGDVTQSRAVFWSRTERTSVMHVAVDTDAGPVHRAQPVYAEDDFTGKIVVDGLKPDHRYSYAVWFSGNASARRPSRGAIRATFQTAPAPETRAAVRFAFGGDLGGQNVCRDRTEGYPVFGIMADYSPDFFLALGDMIYADDECESVGRAGNLQIPGGFGPATTLREYWAHWKYNRADPAFIALLEKTSYIGIWDDHEVVNNFGPENDTGQEPPYVPGVSLMPMARRAFFDYNPIYENPADPHRLYRAFRWGTHVDLIVLDTRQYRDPNRESDRARAPKTMLGREQRQWLENRLSTSTATWKIIVSSVSIGIPTGAGGQAGRDGWAGFEGDTGYEHELAAILRRASDRGIDQLLWLATDVHFASLLVYRPFEDRPGFAVHEIVTGPLSAGLFPRTKLDRTFHPTRLAYYGPDPESRIESYQELKRWLNFGVIDVSASGSLDAAVINGLGERVASLQLDPPRATP